MKKDTPDRLQEIDLKIIDTNECQEKISFASVTDDQICTFTKIGEGACFVSITYSLAYFLPTS